jgi:hypothetical protein
MSQELDPDHALEVDSQFSTDHTLSQMIAEEISSQQPLNYVHASMSQPTDDGGREPTGSPGTQCSDLNSQTIEALTMMHR